jgi:mediator of replication checkpoint protein 1
MTEEEDEDEDGAPRLRRLRRRSATPDKHNGYRSSPSPSPAKPRNAFDMLGRKPERIKAPLFENKKRFEKNEFIEGEAEESDEDAAFGFGPAKKDDEDELDGEDQDRVLEELVDDAAMDADTLNESKVLEKVQEHRALDDAADEKRARDAAEGKMRIKRRNNLLDFDEDDSEEEDWDAKRARERMAKKRRIDGDTLEQIGTCLCICCGAR